MKIKNNRNKQKQNAKDEFNELHFIWKLIFFLHFRFRSVCIFQSTHQIVFTDIDAFTDDIVHKKKHEKLVT